MSGPSVFLSAGEESGDKLGAALAAELLRIRPDVQLFGVGGRRMAAAGVELLADCAPLSVMGYWDVVKSLPAILAVRRRLLAHIKKSPPALFVGIDAPDFNLPAARVARACGAKSVQYVAPSVWMWRRRRLRTIGRAVDGVWCLLPFEKKAYAGHAPAIFVGHPAAQRQLPSRLTARQRLGVGEEEELIALLPGSRRAELARHLPLFAETVERLRSPSRRSPPRRFVLAAASAEAEGRMARALPGALVASFDDALAAADVAIVKSGTATLEAAFAGLPMVVVYRLSTLAYWAARWRKFSLPYFALPNILCRRFVVPELLLDEATAARTAAETERLLACAARRENMRVVFAGLRGLFSAPEKTAADAAAALLPPRLS